METYQVQEALAPLEASTTEDGFEVFAEGRTRQHGPFVTLTANQAQLTLNRPAYELLGKPDWVQVLYHRASQKIALAAATGAPGTFAVKQPYKNRQYYYISLYTFVRYYGVPHEQTWSYPATLDGKRRLMIDLQGQRFDASRRRKRREEVRQEAEDGLPAE
jgi:hypothetical protein